MCSRSKAFVCGLTSRCTNYLGRGTVPLVSSPCRRRGRCLFVHLTIPNVHSVLKVLTTNNATSTKNKPQKNYTLRTHQDCSLDLAADNIFMTTRLMYLHLANSYVWRLVPSSMSQLVPRAGDRSPRPSVPSVPSVITPHHAALICLMLLRQRRSFISLFERRY